MFQPKKITYDKMTFAEVLQDGLFVRKGDVMAFLDATEYDRWFNSSDGGKAIRRLTVDEVKKRFGHDFIVLMSDDARCDRHVMRRFDAERFVNFYNSDCANHVDFYRSSYEEKPTNFY